MAKQILNKIFEDCILTVYHSLHDEVLEKLQNKEWSLRHQLELSIEMRILEFSAKPEDDKFRTLTKDFRIFKSKGKRTPNLQQLLDALYIIKPTLRMNEICIVVTEVIF